VRRNLVTPFFQVTIHWCPVSAIAGGHVQQEQLVEELGNLFVWQTPEIFQFGEWRGFRIIYQVHFFNRHIYFKTSEVTLFSGA